MVDAARDVMAAALTQGGTSFDYLYVDVAGSSGYFSRSLRVYGLAGHPCLRCGTTIIREKFMNRSSRFCPDCQRKRQLSALGRRRIESIPAIGRLADVILAVNVRGPS